MNYFQQYNPQIRYQSRSDISDTQSNVSSTEIAPTFTKRKSVTGSVEGESSESKNPRKRFVWPEALHRDFVAAVFDVGLKNATPKAIMDMIPQSQPLTADHVKSHLQKFRVHRDRARQENLSHYELSVRSNRLPVG